MWFYENLYPDIKLGLKGNLLYKKKTNFQDMELISTPRFGNTLVLDGAIQTTEKDEFIYHEMITHPVLLLHPNPQKVLIIGGGDGGVLREVLKHNVERVCLVEIDSAVIAFCKKYLKNICKNAFDDKRLRLIIDDGARFIRESGDKFDIIIVDSPDPVGPAKVLFSSKFYSLLHSALTKNGIMIRQSGSTILQVNGLKINYKLLKKIFPHVTVQLAAIPTYVGGFFSFLIASCKINPKKPDIKYIERQFKSLNLKTNYYNPEIHVGSLCLPGYVRKLTK